MCRRAAAGVLAVLTLLTPGAHAASCPPPLPTAEAAVVRDRGLLWRITRDGHSSYLYGTMHVGRPAWRRPGPRLEAALAASDLLALELDPDDPELGAALAAGGETPPLPAELQQRLAHALARACIAAAALAGVDPLLQAMTLTLIDARWLGFDAGYAQERLLAAAQRERGRPVTALETAALQMQALMPDDPTERREAIEDSLQQIEDGSGRRVLERLVGAWERGDFQALEHYAQWCECADTESERAQMRRLNDDRNPHLADGIEALHRQGHHLLAAVGALHMTGPQGLPQLLRRRGFAVERIAP
ncbi:MAG: TraB/GumN family protein [Burkholderiales bacterium]|nr:TraB/GumN family protein [Burkholderiales bacterium]